MTTTGQVNQSSFTFITTTRSTQCKEQEFPPKVKLQAYDGYYPMPLLLKQSKPCRHIRYALPQPLVALELESDLGVFRDILSNLWGLHRPPALFQTPVDMST